MQIKATKEVRDYKAVVYFGLSIRQLIFAGMAGGIAVLSYFLLRDHVSMEIISWVCIVAAAPFGAFGFIRWHGMYLEQIIPMLYRSRCLMNQTLYFRPENHGKALVAEYLREERKKGNHASKREKG